MHTMKRLYSGNMTFRMTVRIDLSELILPYRCKFVIMTDDALLYQLVDQDPRYPLEAYNFVRDALSFAADSMELGSSAYFDPELDEEEAAHRARRERHLTGQQLCEAIRMYAINQYGYMAKVVLKNWNVDKTDCFGDIVYNMISIGLMKKSNEDRQTHFNNVYKFEDVFETEFAICQSAANRRSS